MYHVYPRPKSNLSYVDPNFAMTGPQGQYLVSNIILQGPRHMSQVQHDSYQTWLCSALVMYMFQTVSKSLGARALTQAQTMTAAGRRARNSTI